MKYGKKIAIQCFTTVALISLLIIGCTPERKFQVLSFFFDGVPDPNAKTQVVVNIASDSMASLTATANVKPDMYYHKPYNDEKCQSCHESGFSNSLIKPVPELCYTCHEDFNTKYKTVHGPVAFGKCTICHHPHESKMEKLVIREGQQLCLYCHQSKDILENKMHSKIGEKNCTQCHNPHGGENRVMLNSGTCYSCHEDFNNKYNYLHGPVASGNCNTCHNSHNSGKPKLLLQTLQQLCLSCHDIKQVLKNVVHAKIEKKNCTECHNPHGGEDRFILTSELRPYTKKSDSNAIKDSIPETVEATDSIITQPELKTEAITSDSIEAESKIDSVPQINPEIMEAIDSTLTTPELKADTITVDADTIISTGSAVSLITADGPTIFCAGDSVTLTADKAMKYVWSPTAELTRSITIYESGEYNVWMVDENGEERTSATVTVVVNRNPSPVISANGNLEFLEGDSVLLTVTGKNLTSYVWSPGGETAETITVRKAGVFSVTVTDRNGCSGTSSLSEIIVTARPIIAPEDK